MTPGELFSLRKRLDLTQAGLAELMGLSLRAYQDLEGGKSPIRILHVLALERAGEKLAVTAKDPMMAPAAVRRDALDLAMLLRGDTPLVNVARNLLNQQKRWRRRLLLLQSGEQTTRDQDKGRLVDTTQDSVEEIKSWIANGERALAELTQWLGTEDFDLSLTLKHLQSEPSDERNWLYENGKRYLVWPADDNDSFVLVLIDANALGVGISGEKARKTLLAKRESIESAARKKYRRGDERVFLGASELM